MPLSVLTGVDINLSPEMMEAVCATTYSNSAKMGLAMKRRFWEEDDQIFGGHLYSNLPLGEFSYPSNDYFSRKGVLLGLYANGPVGDLLDQPVKARVEHLPMHASKSIRRSASCTCHVTSTFELRPSNFTLRTSRNVGDVHCGLRSLSISACVSASPSVNRWPRSRIESRYSGSFQIPSST